MSVGKRYVLDANVFIEAFQSYYAFDICPGFWLALCRQCDSKRVCSIDRVKAELTALNDDLHNWIKQRPPESFFKKTSDQSVAEVFGEMVNWVQYELSCLRWKWNCRPVGLA